MVPLVPVSINHPTYGPILIIEVETVHQISKIELPEKLEGDVALVIRIMHSTDFFLAGLSAQLEEIKRKLPVKINQPHLVRSIKFPYEIIITKL